MKHIPPKRTGQRGERGYALLMILFFLAILVLSMAVATPSVINDLTREKETEMVWRGKQYVRGIRLYYQKAHRFPAELDDLTKPKMGLRFMRQAYKDPMNTVDGSWRLIYLGPGGTLIGSLKTRCLNATLTSQAGVSNFGNPVSTGTSSGFGSSPNSFSQSSSFGGSSFSTSFGSSGSSSSSSDSTAGGSAAAACGGPTADASGNPSGSNQGSSDTMGQPHDITSSDQPQSIVGGSIVGVGSKVDKRSFLWYEKARNYRLFEFVWDPTVDIITGRRIGTFPGQLPGAVTPGTVNPVGTTSQGNNPNPAQTQNPPMNPNAPQQDPLPPLQAPPNP